MLKNLLKIYEKLSLDNFFKEKYDTEHIKEIKKINLELEIKTNEYRVALIHVVTSVSKALEIRDPYTFGHQQRVSNISGKIAKKMELSNDMIEGIQLGAGIHDIGKLSTPTEFLVKPSRLTPLEYELIKTHSTVGGNIFKSVNFPWKINEIITQHHERIDGSGYPNGLKKEEISLEARIVAVADVYECMTSHRPYRPALDKKFALDELTNNSGILYDSDAVNALLKIIQ